MTRRIAGPVALLGVLVGHGLAAREAAGQAALADDIIVAAQGKENAERNRESALGAIPGATASPYRRSPGSNDIRLGTEGGQRLQPLPRASRRPVNPASFSTPGSEGEGTEHGLAPAIERLRIPGPFPIGGLVGPWAGPDADLGEDEGPPDGLTLDAAIERLVHANSELRIKALEIPQADADILTAGLRDNPLLFYASDSVPYGSYSRERPGDIEHGISVVYPIDFSGKRRSRVALARQEKCVLEAQFQDAVRLAIDDLYTAYVDALAARQAVRVAERSLRLIDQLLRAAQAEGAGSPEAQQELDDLVIERDVAAMAVGDERELYEKAKQRLGLLLNLTPEQAAAIEPRGSVRVLAPTPPPAEALVAMALACRPDLIANRRGIARARAELDFEWSERFSDAYLLYTPYGFHDNSQAGGKSATTWGAGLFFSAPLFNRNQGNLRRARINVVQSHHEAAEVQNRVISEVQQAARDFRNTYNDVLHLEQVTLPAVRRKHDRGWERLRTGEIGPADVLILQRDSTSLVRYYRDTLVRHRRNTLRINTVVGRRLLP